MNLIKDSDAWSGIAKEILGDTEHFWETLMNDDEVTVKACEEHKEKMLEDLSKKLGIDVILTDDIRQKLLQLTFKAKEDESILCNYCEKKATIYGIYSRPDTRAMSKLIKLQLKEEEVNGINSCIKESFKEIGRNTNKPYFGDIIYSEVYSKLNDYVHSNITEEPTISQWFYEFFIPTIIILQCILSRPLWTTNQNKWYIGKETNNLDETNITGIEEDDYLEYDNVMEFYNWILSLKPKDVRDMGISERELKRKKAEIRKGKILNPKTKIVKILVKLYKEYKVKASN